MVGVGVVPRVLCVLRLVILHVPHGAVVRLAWCWALCVAELTLYADIWCRGMHARAPLRRSPQATPIPGAEKH